MKTFLSPSVADDRLTELDEASEVWQRHRLISTEEREALRQRSATSWRRYGTAVSVVFFALTALGVTAMFGLCDLLHVPKGVITASLSIVAAELLIRKARFFGTGIESALWLGGLLAVIFDLPSSGRPEAVLVFAAAFAMAGLRVRNALMETVAVILLVVYSGLKSPSLWLPLLVGAGIAIVAAVALQRSWQRLSSEHFLAALVVAMPATGYVVGAIAGKRFEGLHPQGASIAVTAMLLMIAAVLFAFAVRGKDRVLLVGGFSPLLLAAVENWQRIAWSVEVKCMAAGVILAALGVVLSRVLRARTEGFVATPVDSTSYGELAQIGGALLVAHPSATDDGPAFTRGGGGFGGGGASGDY